MQRQGAIWRMERAALMPQANGFILPSSVMQRSFFNKNKSKKGAEAEEASEQTPPETTDDTEKAAKQKKEPSSTATDDKDAAASAKEEEEQAQSTSSDEELNSEDVKKIRELIKDQDATIEDLESKVETYEKSIKDLKQKLVYQIAENDNTVKRYRKQIEESKQFAISKFAKELLDVRDNLGLALQHVDMDKVKEIEDIELLKTQFENVVKGQEMTSGVMDKTLAQFDVVQFDPIDEKFDPNVHDA